MQRNIFAELFIFLDQRICTLKVVLLYLFSGSTSSCTLEEPPEEIFNEYGKTEFEKLLFNPRTRTVSTNDFQFAHSIGTGENIKYNIYNIRTKNVGV